MGKGTKRKAEEEGPDPSKRKKVTVPVKDKPAPKPGVFIEVTGSELASFSAQFGPTPDGSAGVNALELKRLCDRLVSV